MNTCLQNNPACRPRKPHRCYLCCQWIAIKEVCVKRVCVNEDGFWTGYMHPECDAATYDWDGGDWECFEKGSMERPTKKEESK